MPKRIYENMYVKLYMPKHTHDKAYICQRGYAKVYIYMQKSIYENMHAKVHAAQEIMCQTTYAQIIYMPKGCMCQALGTRYIEAYARIAWCIA